MIPAELHGPRGFTAWVGRGTSDPEVLFIVRRSNGPKQWTPAEERAALAGLAL